MDVDPIEAPQEPLGAIIPYEPRPLAEPIEDTSSGELMQPTSAPLAMSFEAQYIAEATREVLAPVVDRLSSQVGSLEARQHVLERLSGTVDRAIPEIEGQIGQASQGIQNLGQNTQEALTKAGVQMEAMGQHLDEVHTRAKEAVGNLDARLQKVERQVKRNHEALDEWELQYYAAHGSEQMNHDAHGSIIQQMGFLFERCTKMEKWAADQVTKGHSDAQFSSEMEELFDRLEHLENEHQKDRQVAQYLQATIKGWPSFGQISGGLEKSVEQLTQRLDQTQGILNSQWQDVRCMMAGFEKKVSQQQLAADLEDRLFQRIQGEIMGQVAHSLGQLREDVRVMLAKKTEEDEKGLEAMHQQWELREGCQDARVQELEKRTHSSRYPLPGRSQEGSGVGLSQVLVLVARALHPQAPPCRNRPLPRSRRRSLRLRPRPTPRGPRLVYALSLLSLLQVEPLNSIPPVGIGRALGEEGGTGTGHPPRCP